MFAFLIRKSLLHRVMVLCAVAGLITVSVMQMRQVPVDVLPDIDRSVVQIMTECGGLSPEEVERRVSFPIETAMTGIKDVTMVRSTSSVGLSVVVVSFALDTDTYRNRQLVVERLVQAAAQLPANVTPELAPLSSAVGQILRIALTSDNQDMMALRDIADWVVRPRLLAVPGVAQVLSVGGEVRQLRVTPDPRRLDFYGASVDQIEDALAGFNTNSNGSAVDQNGRRFQIVNVGAARNATALLDRAGDLVIGTPQGRPLLLREVASVAFKPRVKQGDAGFMGQHAVMMQIQRQPGVNTLEVTQNIKKVLADLQPFMPPGVHIDNILFEQAQYIEKSIANLIEVIIEAAAVVSIVLFVFLLNFRTTIISLTAIPLSLLVTLSILGLAHMTVNTMTLGGLAIAVGELVDDGVVGVENIYRRLRLNRRLASPHPVLQVIADATVEVRSGIFYATLIVLLVLFPLFALPGVQGLMFEPLATTYVISILVSLLMSITLTPVLAYYLLPGMKRMAHGDGALVGFLKRQNERLLGWAFDHWKSVVVVTAVAVTIAAVDVVYLPRAFLPPLNEGTYQVELNFRPGISLAQSTGMARAAEELFRAIPEVTVVGHRTGRAELDLDADAVSTSDIVVNVKLSERPASEVVQDIRKRASVIPASVEVTTPMAERIDVIMTGLPSELAVKVYGPDLDVLVKLADQLRGHLAQIPGLVDLKLETQARIPQLRVRILPDVVQLYGITPTDLARTLETLLAGRVVSQIMDEDRRYDVLVRLDDADRTSAALKKLLIDTPAGHVPLGELAEITDTDAPSQIVRDNGQRRIAVLANTNGANMTAVTRAIEQQIARIKAPAGYYFLVEGNYQQQQDAMLRIGALSLISLVLVFAILYSRYNSAVLSVIIMANVPLALVGSVIALRVSGGMLSLASMIGFVTLAGISTRNGILKISHYINLVLHEGERFGRPMIVRGSLERMTPVLMTALSAGVALIPIIIGGADAGKEVLSPVAVVIFGGLISATLLDALLTPILFLKFGAKPLARLQEQTLRGRGSEAY